MEYYSALKKERNPTICSNMGEPGGRYAKWNKAFTEGQILHDPTFMNYLHSLIHREQNSSHQQPRGGSGDLSGINFSYVIWISSREMLHSIMPIANSYIVVFCAWKFKRVDNMLNVINPPTAPQKTNKWTKNTKGHKETFVDRYVY